MKTDTPVTQIRSALASYYLNDPSALDRAVEKILHRRQTIISLLQQVRADVATPQMDRGIENLLAYLDRSGFYYRPSSDTHHHNVPGGLAQHSLDTYRVARLHVRPYPSKSIILTALCHDLCKADSFGFHGRTIYQENHSHGHGGRSLRLLDRLGVPLTADERHAILHHMHTSVSRHHGLSTLIFWADKADAHLWCNRHPHFYLHLLSRSLSHSHRHSRSHHHTNPNLLNNQ